MPDLAHFIINDILYVLIIACLAMSVPLSVLCFVNRMHWKRARKRAEEISAEIYKVLSDPQSCREATTEERVDYAKDRTLSFAKTYFAVLCLYVLGIIFKVGNISNSNGAWFGAAVWTAIFVLVLLSNLIYVAPWAKVYRIKAVKCYEVSNTKESSEYVCYHDFVKDKMEVGRVDVSLGEERVKCGTMYDVLAVAKKSKIKVFGKTKIGDINEYKTMG